MQSCGWTTLRPAFAANNLKSSMNGTVVDSIKILATFESPLQFEAVGDRRMQVFDVILASRTDVVQPRLEALRSDRRIRAAGCRYSRRHDDD
jgi:hypothetical protein